MYIWLFIELPLLLFLNFGAFIYQQYILSGVRSVPDFKDFLVSLKYD